MPSVNSNNSSHDADNKLEEVMMEEEVRGRRGVSSPAPRPILLILIVCCIAVHITNINSVLYYSPYY